MRAVSRGLLMIVIGISGFEIRTTLIRSEEFETYEEDMPRAVSILKLGCDLG